MIERKQPPGWLDDGSTNCNMKFSPKWDLEFQFESHSDEGDSAMFDFRMRGEDAEILLCGQPIMKGVFDAETQRICWHREDSPWREGVGDDANDSLSSEYHEMRKNLYLRFGEV